MSSKYEYILEEKDPRLIKQSLLLILMGLETYMEK